MPRRSSWKAGTYLLLEWLYFAHPCNFWCPLHCMNSSNAKCSNLASKKSETTADFSGCSERMWLRKGNWQEWWWKLKTGTTWSFFFLWSTFTEDPVIRMWNSEGKQLATEAVVQGALLKHRRKQFWARKLLQSSFQQRILREVAVLVVMTNRCDNEADIRAFRGPQMRANENDRPNWIVGAFNQPRFRRPMILNSWHSSGRFANGAASIEMNAIANTPSYRRESERNFESFRFLSRQLRRYSCLQLVCHFYSFAYILFA